MKNIEGRTVYSVTEVNNLARQNLENLSFWVEGEVSSFKGLNNHYRYLYFDLKDPQTGYKLPCLLEPKYYQSLEIPIEDGKSILALGNLTLWEKDGRYQMYIHQVEDFGEGLLLLQLEKLKQKLAQKGYFDNKYKKGLPSFPLKIAVITSKASDAWHDFKKHTQDKYPIIQITLLDVLVQGTHSASQIIKAIKNADQKNFQAIVLIRGGGSLEDLSAYNDELLADTIFNAKTCIVVGVGHEKDITIAQLTADIPASTPTDAAKIITSDFASLEEKLDNHLTLLKRSFYQFFSSASQNLDLIFTRLGFHKEKYQDLAKRLQFSKQSLKGFEAQLININRQKLKEFFGALDYSRKFHFEKNQNTVKLIFEKLQLLSPQKTLQRGYSITKDEKNHILKDAFRIALGTNIKVKLARGIVSSKVFKKEI